jgi:hypothetical protein
MEELVQDSIIVGTDNNLGISDQLISIQMLLAWVPVIMEQITLDTPLMLQVITKVIMDVKTSTMTIKPITAPKDSEVEVEAGVVILVEVVTGTEAPMTLSHSSFHNNSVQLSSQMDLQVTLDYCQQLQRLRQMWMSSVGRYVKNQKAKKVRPLKIKRTEMRPRSRIRRTAKIVYKLE